MDINFDNLENDLKIDEADLGKEWIQQPNLFMKYSRMAVDLKSEATLAKESLKVLEAEISHNAFSNPQELLGTGRPTNDRVDAYVTNHPAVIEARDRSMKAAHEANMAEAAVFAFHQKKAALENLVILAQMNYFSSPNIKKDKVDVAEIDRTIKEREFNGRLTRAQKREARE